MKIVIGKADSRNVELDLDVLLSTRMLLTADSGGGKTFAIKRIIEQAFGKIQIIGVDPEGEFSPLREKFGFVLVGKGGETPADTRSARLVAQTILKLRANAICDLYEMKPSERHIWVRDFCDGLLEAPKEHRHPCLVIIDEAHMFAPEHGKGESVASDAVIGLCTRGRKRLLVPLFATQRLATLSKDASSMLLNRMVGGTFEDVNRKRAAEVLGIERAGLQDFYDEIKTLEPGYFFCLGRAISKERVLVHVGKIQTAHGQDALKYEITPPPPPDKIKALLPKLSDLPKQAEEKARTEGELRREIRELKNQLRAQPIPNYKCAPVPLVPDQKAIDRAVREVAAKFSAQLTEAQKAVAKQQRTFKLIAEAATQGATIEIPKFGPIALPKVSAGEIKKKEGQSSNAPLVTERPATHHSRPNIDGDASRAVGVLAGPERKILVALVQLRAIDKHTPPREMVAGWAGYSPNGGAFRNPLGALNSRGFVSYPTNGTVTLTSEGLEQIGEQDPPDADEIKQRILGVCTGPERKILSALLELGEEVGRHELAAKAGYEPNGGAFRNPLGALRTKGFVEYPRADMVKAADWLFIE